MLQRLAQRSGFSSLTPASFAGGPSVTGRRGGERVSRVLPIPLRRARRSVRGALIGKPSIVGANFQNKCCAQPAAQPDALTRAG